MIHSRSHVTSIYEFLLRLNWWLWAKDTSTSICSLLCLQDQTHLLTSVVMLALHSIKCYHNLNRGIAKWLATWHMPPLSDYTECSSVTYSIIISSLRNLVLKIQAHHIILCEDKIITFLQRQHEFYKVSNAAGNVTDFKLQLTTVGPPSPCFLFHYTIAEYWECWLFAVTQNVCQVGNFCHMYATCHLSLCRREAWEVQYPLCCWLWGAPQAAATMSSQRLLYRFKLKQR